ncbi:MAG: proton-conducting transporter membrane subunit, partial [Sphingomonadaceae bacterium]|nr:proton-conducting transporter membrane subunit [Sphingomonadaceae bacterium]
AFFKALLFLGAGSVIHAMHHEQDMRYYGGLRRDIPITFIAMLIGTVAITGVWPLAGYFSKDAILEAAFMSGSEAGIVAFFVGIFAALLTSFYSWRLMFLTFFGKPRWADSEHIQHAVHHHDEPAAAEGTTDSDEVHRHAAPANDHHHAPGTAGYHPHESPWSMLIPLIVLATGAALAGWLFHDVFADAEAGQGFWRGSLAFDSHLMHALHDAPAWVVYSPMVAWMIGLLLAINSYLLNTGIPGRFVATFRGLHNFLMHKWYFDELYDVIFVRPAFWVGRLFWRRGDQGTIDRFGPDGVAAAVQGTAAVARRLQTGYVYTYALVMLIGLAAAASWFLPRVLGGN